ncbi:MAG: hypothetical protein GY941_22275 [Planctomycetes bacterium]|nr:hypothetical protein [Planctomycetota bacterium]
MKIRCPKCGSGEVSNHPERMGFVQIGGFWCTACGMSTPLPSFPIEGSKDIFYAGENEELYHEWYVEEV